MLTLYDFNGLNDDEKANAVWEGTFLADRREEDLTVQLYSVGNFYVEVFYDAGLNKIVRFRSFTTKSLLVPYLAHIKFDLQ
jgi:hypothetical protein